MIMVLTAAAFIYFAARAGHEVGQVIGYATGARSEDRAPVDAPQVNS